MIRELEYVREALLLIEKKGARWHPCSKEVVALNKAITTLDRILNQDEADWWSGWLLPFKEHIKEALMTTFLKRP
jgi:hypothetical protein